MGVFTKRVQATSTGYNPAQALEEFTRLETAIGTVYDYSTYVLEYLAATSGAVAEADGGYDHIVIPFACTIVSAIVVCNAVDITPAAPEVALWTDKGTDATVLTTNATIALADTKYACVVDATKAAVLAGEIHTLRFKQQNLASCTGTKMIVTVKRAIQT